MSGSRSSSGCAKRRRPAAALLLLLLLSWLWPSLPAAAEPPVTFRFHGLQAFDEARLRAAAAQELDDFIRLERRPAEIDDAAYLMSLAYRRAGYYFAEVDYRLQEDERGLRVDFLVSEGPPVQVREIIPAGNTLLADRELIALVEEILRDGPGSEPPPLIASRLREARTAIRERYLSAGYREAVVEIDQLRFGPERLPAEAIQEALPRPAPDRVAGEPLPPLAADLRLLIQEGQRQTIVAVRLDDAAFPDRRPAEIAEALAEAAAELVGQPYFTRRKLLLRSRLLGAYHQLGHPEARVVVHDEPGEMPGEVVLRAEAAGGPAVLIEEIEISGQQRSRESFIRRRLSIQPGDLYRDSARRESFRELYRTGIFTRIEIDISQAAETAVGDPSEPEPRTLLVNLEERSTREVFVEAGWGSYEMLRGRVGFTDRNLFGAGRILRLESGASLKGGEIRAGITDPWLLESRITADLPVFYRVRQEPSFTRSEVGAGLVLSRELPHAMAVSLGYQIRRSEISSIEADTALESADSGYGIASIRLLLNRDTRDDIFFPSHGLRAFGAVEVADRTLGSGIDFYRFNAGLRYFYPLSARLVLGLRADSGLILPGRNQAALPLGERFYSGGENSVRSFKEGMLGPKDLAGQPVGGMAFNLLSVELRRRLGDNLALSLFFDYGNLAPNRSRVEEGKTTAATRSELINATFSDYLKDFRPGLGAGFQYLLPVGPARLDFAFNPGRRPENHEPDWVVHFSLGMAF